MKLKSEPKFLSHKYRCSGCSVSGEIGLLNYIGIHHSTCPVCGRVATWEIKEGSVLDIKVHPEARNVTIAMGLKYLAYTSKLHAEGTPFDTSSIKCITKKIIGQTEDSRAIVEPTNYGVGLARVIVRIQQ